MTLAASIPLAEALLRCAPLQCRGTLPDVLTSRQSHGLHLRLGSHDKGLKVTTFNAKSLLGIKPSLVKPPIAKTKHMRFAKDPRKKTAACCSQT